MEGRASPSWTPAPPATCRTCWRCPTARPSTALAGPTCLAGDVIGDYGFDAPLAEGDLLLFGDMAIYTTCKNNTFNGMPLPAIYALREGGALEPLRTFGYEDFKTRLGT